jgi:hypothetical protein
MACNLIVSVFGVYRLDQPLGILVISVRHERGSTTCLGGYGAAGSRSRHQGEGNIVRRRGGVRWSFIFIIFYSYLLISFFFGGVSWSYLVAVL